MLVVLSNPCGYNVQVCVWNVHAQTCIRKAYADVTHETCGCKAHVGATLKSAGAKPRWVQCPKLWVQSPCRRNA